VAAMLLRKTTTSQVMKVYGEFLRRYPTPAALASASVEELRELLKLLGIENQRAQLFKSLAEKLAELGGVPCDRGALKRLPGVGDYAAWSRDRSPHLRLREETKTDPRGRQAKRVQALTFLKTLSWLFLPASASFLFTSNLFGYSVQPTLS